MKKTSVIFIFLYSLLFGQIKPPLPKGNTDSITILKQQIPIKKKQKKLLIFDVSLSKSTMPKSIYYYKKIAERLQDSDTTLTAKQIVSITKYNISKQDFSPSYLDSLSNKIYKLNEDKEYTAAIILSEKLLKISPNNIVGHKEISLAYKKIGNINLSEKHLQMMDKIIKSIFKYGDGSYKAPFLINNFFEGISIYEACFRCKPTRVTLMLDKNNRLLGAYKCYSSYLDEYFIKYSELSHWKKEMKDGDYIVEPKEENP